MQQGLGPRPYDVTTRRLIDLDPAAWLRWAGLSVDGPVQVVDSEISTVLAEVDKVIRVEGPTPWLAHLELQTTYDRTLTLRMVQYFGIFLRLREMRIESTIVLLRPEADGPAMTGFFEQTVPPGRTRALFQFPVIRVWQHPVEELLSESLGLLPLAPLADLGRASLPDVIARMDDRVAADAPPELVPDFWASTRILMGLRYDREVVRRVIRRVREMRESVTYQEILEEGREEGLVQGQVQGERRLVLLLGTSKFGPPGDTVRQELESIADLAELDRLAQRLLTASSWDELLEGRQ